jgi:hypothetical protein
MEKTKDRNMFREYLSCTLLYEESDKHNEPATFFADCCSLKDNVNAY